MAGTGRQRRGLLNLGMLVVVVLLAVTVWRVSRPKAPAGHILMPGLHAADIRHITLTRGDRPKLEFALEAGVWRIVAPLQARANRMLMQSLLALPETRSQRHYAAKGLDLAQYGLSPPRVTIDYGDTHTLALGTLNALNRLRYVLAGQQLYLIQDALADLPESAARRWISLDLLPPHARIRDLALPGLSIRALSPSSWTVTPHPPKLRSDQVTQLLRNWTLASAYRITATPKAPAGGKPAQPVAITLDNGTLYRFEVISTQPELVLRRDKLGVDYHLPAAMAKALLSLAPPPATSPHDSGKGSLPSKAP
ncbi:DUF4340 domain-containing protein [Acidihalobacter prosperus]|nr:DUF4340 domain-containing protein [Acidihalobacter prosperus]